MASRVSKKDLRNEFYNDFYRTYPYKAEISLLALLIRRSVLKVKKCKRPKEFQLCLFKGIFLEHLPWTEHLKNYAGITDFVLNKLVQDYYALLADARYTIRHEPWYFGYRADLGIVPLGSDNANDILLAVEMGNTAITKIIECITNLSNLQAIWHAPDEHTLFIWSKGKNGNKLRETLLKHDNYLSKLYQRELKLRSEPQWVKL